MPDYELVHVYSVENPIKAEIIKESLEKEGITCFLEGENQAGLAGVLEIRVMVPSGEAQRAHALIEAHETHHADDALAEDEAVDDE